MRAIIVATALMLGTASALAAQPEGMNLSEIIAKIEQTADFHYIDDVSWDDDGYYEIDYHLKNGSEVEVNIDPKTGNTVK